ncbi:MAG: glycosyltransferase [Candidatus Hydrogenedentota bacterium]|nr:MAG: glycosyltransferase [Candidatus Hydrogenedentota bacterium]
MSKSVKRVVSTDWILHENYDLFLLENTLKALKANKSVALKWEKSVLSPFFADISLAEAESKLPSNPWKNFSRWFSILKQAETEKICRHLAISQENSVFLFSIGQHASKLFLLCPFVEKSHLLFLEPSLPVQIPYETLVENPRLKEIYGKPEEDQWKEAAALEKEAITKAEKIFCISETSRKQVETLYEKKAELIPPCVADHIFYESRKEDPEYYFISPSLMHYPVWENVVNAFRYIKDKIVFASFDKLPSEFQTKMQFNESFTLLASLTEKAILMAKAKAVLSPFRGFDSTAFEALKMGIPVIASRHNPVASYITEENGILMENSSEEEILAAIFRFEKLSFSRAKGFSNTASFTREAYRNAIAHIVGNS